MVITIQYWWKRFSYDWIGLFSQDKLGNGDEIKFHYVSDIDRIRYHTWTDCWGGALPYPGLCYSLKRPLNRTDWEKHMTNRNIVFTVTTVWLIFNIIFWTTMMFLYPNSLTGSNRANAYDEIKIILEKCLISNNVTFFPFHYFITFVIFSIIFISL